MILGFGDVEIDADLFEVRVRGVVIPFHVKAFNVLLYLAQNRHRVVLKRELLAQVWSGVVVTDNALVQAIAVIRTTLLAANAPDLVTTVRGRGYRLVAPAEPTREASAVLERPVTRLAARDPLGVVLRAALDGAGGAMVVDHAEAPHVHRALELASASVCFTATADASSGSLGMWRSLMESDATGVVLMDHVVATLQEAAARGRVAVVAERVDVADVASLLLFEHVARLEIPNLVLVGTADTKAISRSRGAGSVLTRLLWPGTSGPPLLRMTS